MVICFDPNMVIVSHVVLPYMASLLTPTQHATRHAARRLRAVRTRAVQQRCAVARAPPPARLLGLHRSRTTVGLLLLSSSSLDKSRVEFAPVRGPIGGALAEWTLPSAQGVRSRGAATLHSIQPRHWPSEAASQQPWPKRARKQRRVRTSRFAGRPQSCRWAKASTSESRHVGRPAMQQSSEAVRSSARLCA